MYIFRELDNDRTDIQQLSLFSMVSELKGKGNENFLYISVCSYLSLPPTRQDLTQGQKPEGRLKWE